MKKLLVLALVLSMATMANAALTLGTSATQLAPTESAVLSITGDGTDGVGTFYLGIIVDGPGALSFDNATMLYAGNASGFAWDVTGVGPMLNLIDPVIEIQFNGTPPVGQENPPLVGLLADGLTMTCGGLGDVVVQLFDGNGTLMSEVTIAQPEPITIGLLGLGAMFLRRRK
jgi:hypothetical protein